MIQSYFLNILLIIWILLYIVQSCPTINILTSQLLGNKTQIWLSLVQGPRGLSLGGSAWAGCTEARAPRWAEISQLIAHQLHMLSWLWVGCLDFQCLPCLTGGVSSRRAQTVTCHCPRGETRSNQSGVLLGSQLPGQSPAMSWCFHLPAPVKSFHVSLSHSLALVHPPRTATDDYHGCPMDTHL